MLNLILFHMVINKKTIFKLDISIRKSGQGRLALALSLGISNEIIIFLIHYYINFIIWKSLYAQIRVHLD